MTIIGSFMILKHGNIGGFLDGYFFTILKHVNIESDHQVGIPGIINVCI